jgi:hypothetical protein
MNKEIIKINLSLAEYSGIKSVINKYFASMAIKAFIDLNNKLIKVGVKLIIAIQIK